MTYANEDHFGQFEPQRRLTLKSTEWPCLNMIGLLASELPTEVYQQLLKTSYVKRQIPNNSVSKCTCHTFV